MHFLSIFSAFCMTFFPDITDSFPLTNEQRLLLDEYRLDPSFLSEFPFSAYEILDSVSQGSFYVDIPNCDYIKTTLASQGIWEPEIVELLKTYVKPGTIAIDVGAHIGTHTVTMSHAVGSKGAVLAFEPQAKIHRELVLNLELNQCNNVLPLHAALGKDKGEAYLEPIRTNNEGYRCISSKNREEKISVLKLDDFHLSPVSCIKIDAESYELEVLQGAYETILSNKPAIIIEIGGGWSREQEEGINPKEYLSTVINLLENELGYEVTLIASITGDYLALPKQEGITK